MALNERFENLTLERRGNIFILTLRQGLENKLDAPFCQEIIRAFHSIQRDLGTAEGAVITYTFHFIFAIYNISADRMV